MSTRFNHSLPSSLRLPDLHNKVGKACVCPFCPSDDCFQLFATLRFLQICGRLQKVITRREIFAPFNCYLDILLALRNYSWISGLPLIEATNLLREETNRVPAQQAHTLISLTNSVPLYHSDNFYIQRLRKASGYCCSPTIARSHRRGFWVPCGCFLPRLSCGRAGRMRISLEQVEIGEIG